MIRKQYVKKPIPIYALQITQRTTIYEVNEWASIFEEAPEFILDLNIAESVDSFRVKSAEGWITGLRNDYLMRGIKGEFYICSREVFKASYDLIPA